ncbi:MAG: peptidoglycan DD-metalloendopeptidase family protein [Thermodesulfobacteriota bacterium]
MHRPASSRPEPSRARQLASRCLRGLRAFCDRVCRFRNRGQRQLSIFINTSHFLTLGVTIALAVAFFLFAVDGQLSQRPKPTQVAQEEPLPSLREIVGEIRPGDSFTSSLQHYGVDEETRLSLVNAFKGHLNFKTLKPNDRFVLTLDKEGDLVKCLVETGPLDVHSVERVADGSLETKKLDVPIDCRTVKVSGAIESSLYAAFSARNEEHKLIHAFADIFASRIDFNTELQPGDTFEVVVEKYFKGEEFIGYGRLLMARYDSQTRGQLEAYRFAANGRDEDASYFDREGNAFGSSFIRSPLPLGKVTSGYTMARRHPVLDIIRPHQGIDLSAPTGTPVMAAADGKVTFAGWKGGYGKQVIVEHSGGYATYYSHLSGFANGVEPGDRVRQRQIIGYVGSTGMSTGPHLDYRMAQNGAFMNPFSLKFKPLVVLAGNQLAAYRREVGDLTMLASNLSDPTVVLVRNLVVTPKNRPLFL